MHSDESIEEAAAQIERLTLKHTNRIRKFIDRRSAVALLQSTTVDDLFQETALAAVESARTFVYSGDAGFMGWIKTIATRTIARSSARAERGPQELRIKRAQSSGVGFPDTSLYAKERTPSSLVVRGERDQTLLDAINSLAPDHRRVLILYKLEERSLKEAAARLDRTVGATAQLLRRATRELHARLPENG